MGSATQLVTSNWKLVNRELVTSYKKNIKVMTSIDIRIRALGIAEGLTSTQSPNDMTAWYCKAYKLLGEQKYAIVASTARQGKNPPGLFATLLKEELSNV